MVRRAGMDDLAGLAALRRRWLEEDGLPPGTDPGFEQRFTDWLTAFWDTRVFFVASVGDELIGMMNLALFDRMPAPGRPSARWGYLGNAFVPAEHRAAGVGRAILDELLAHARAEGLVRVVLAPSERSVEFYRRAGFGPADMLMAQVLR
ncbi:GNAT family N-acetyltransferase [Allocatelliglobosispora scoriae]|nr:GNAT family N-acetyltransferase [Allocatelliglobosispora scoriae]